MASQMKKFLRVGEALYENGYFDEAEFFLTKVVENDAPRKIQADAAWILFNICNQVKRADDAERFEQLFRELKEISPDSLPQVQRVVH